MSEQERPIAAQLFALVLVLCSIVMAWLGSMAAGYFVPAICLALQAALLWSGRARRFFTGVMLVNQVTGLVLILVLWFGDGLGHLKLNISGVMLLLNLLCGGPLMSLLGAPLLASLCYGSALPKWFSAARA